MIDLRSDTLTQPSEAMRAAMAAAPEADTPVAAGENVLTVDLGIVFELGR